MAVPQPFCLPVPLCLPMPFSGLPPSFLASPPWPPAQALVETQCWCLSKEMSGQGHGSDGGTPGFFPESLTDVILLRFLRPYSFTAGISMWGGQRGEASLGGLEGESEWGALCVSHLPWQSSLQTYLISLRPASRSPGFQGSGSPSLPLCPAFTQPIMQTQEAGSAWKGDWGGPRVLLGERKFHPTGPCEPEPDP